MTHLTTSPDRLTAKPQEVVHGSEQLHGHVVVHQGVLQHARLQAQVPHVLPHAPLAPLLVMSERQNAWKHVTAKARRLSLGTLAKQLRSFLATKAAGGSVRTASSHHCQHASWSGPGAQ